MLLYLTHYGSEFSKLLTDPEREVRCLAIMVLFNLSVIHKNRHRLLRHKVLENLQTLLPVSVREFQQISKYQRRALLSMREI